MQVAEEFNNKYPQRNPVPQSAIAKLLKKFKETGSVADKPR
jgi:hypothetical protein